MTENNRGQKGAKERAEQAAEREGEVLPARLLEEIEPLLRTYYLGDVARDANDLYLRLPNGQIFRMTIVEII